MSRKSEAEKALRLFSQRSMHEILKDKYKKEKVKRYKEGPRKKFIEKYKAEGYDSAKKEVNSGFKQEMFPDEILKRWIQEDSTNER